MWLCIVQKFGHEGWGHRIQESSTLRQQPWWGAGEGTWIECLQSYFPLSCLCGHQQMGGKHLKYWWSLCPVVLGERLCTSVFKKDIGYFIKNMRSESDPQDLWDWQRGREVDHQQTGLYPVQRGWEVSAATGGTHSVPLVVYHSSWGKTYRSVSRIPPREDRDEG
jgi:hypothetical protein